MPPDPLIEALKRPECYGFPGAAVEFLQTHISYVFLVGERVYKVKKPVSLGFLDYSTLSLRHQYCALEVELNRRLNPEVYLGVAPITRSESGEIRIRGHGEVVEYAVEMRRLPQDRMLDRLLEAGAVDEQTIREIADLIAGFHQRCEAGPSVARHGTPDAIERTVRDTLEALRGHCGDSLADPTAVLSFPLHEHLSASLLGFIAKRRNLLEKRAAGGRVREGHGDLHASNLCVLTLPVLASPIVTACVFEDLRRRIVAFDCIEFNPAFRCCDVASDLAFLAMDLDFRGFRDLSSALLRRYVESSKDPELLLLVDFYKQHRAAIRGLVHALKAADPRLDDNDRKSSLSVAREYQCLAASYTLRPALVLMCGLPGSGKSFLARTLARPFDAAHVQSDVVRKQLLGLPPTSRTKGEESERWYGPEMTQRTYAALEERARQHLEDGRLTIVDATFPRKKWREPFAAAAAELNAPLLVVHCLAPEEVIRQRMLRRKTDSAEPSDADFDVYLKSRERFEPPEEIPASRLITADSRSPIDFIRGQLLDRWIEQDHLNR